VIMTAWKRLYEHVRRLSEGTQYRGVSDMRLKDLEELGDAIGINIDPKGGTARVEYKFKPHIMPGWQDKPGAALAIATTDTKRQVQTGNAQGGTVHKTNWGGTVANVPAPIRRHPNDHMGSTMDRYDVIIVADTDNGVMSRLAWSPGIGSSEERRSRLEMLMAGRQPPPLSRRPQGDLPVFGGHADDARQHAPAAVQVPRIGHNARPSHDDDGAPRPQAQGGGRASSDFKQRLAKISRKSYKDADDKYNDGEE
jgi:hypothetical protein